MSPSCATFQEGAASIPVRSFVPVRLQYAPNGDSGILTLHKDFATAPLLRYSQLARRTLVDEDHEAFTVDCRDIGVHPEYYNQVLQFVADHCFHWKPVTSKAKAPRILHGNITCLRDATGTYAALLTFDLVKSVRQDWVRLWIIEYAEQRILTPAELNLLWNVLRKADPSLVKYAVDSVAESWDRDLFGPNDFSCLAFIAENVPELWKRLDCVMGNYKLNPHIRHLTALLLPDDDIMLQRQEGLSLDTAGSVDVEDIANGEGVKDDVGFGDSIKFEVAQDLLDGKAVEWCIDSGNDEMCKRDGM
jgi:hypothetical protein